MKVFIATTSFGKNSALPKNIIKKNNIKVVSNKSLPKNNIKELLSFIENVDGIIAGTEIYSSEILKQLPQLKVISRLGVGMDNIDIKYANERGIKVFATKTTPANAVAELVLGFMLNIIRNISAGNQALKSGLWEKQMGGSLYGKTLGIIGLGKIGKELVKISKGFNFELLAFDELEDDLFAKANNITYCDLKTLLTKADIVSIHLNLTESTRNLIDKNELNLMKPEAILINTSRGSIVNEDALYEVLHKSKIFGAGLDVFKNEPYYGPLTKLNNIILTPHIGSYSKEIGVKMEIEAANNLIEGLFEK